MKRGLSFVLALVLLLMASQTFAQGRKAQIELYGGAAFPLSPDLFKDFYKVGISGNAQYVIFPSPKLGISVFAGYEGFTVDAEAIGDASAANLVGRPIIDPNGNIIGEVTDGRIDAEGTASAVKFGIGIRPYLSNPESSTQFFLFGTGTFNLLKTKTQINGGSYTGRDLFGRESTFQLSDADITSVYGAKEFKDDTEKFGLAGGAGIEVPAGESFNLIFQGLFNIIFTEDESTSFLGVTAGVVF
jgi:hypothetical protein